MSTDFQKRAISKTLNTPKAHSSRISDDFRDGELLFVQRFQALIYAQTHPEEIKSPNYEGRSLTRSSQARKLNMITRSYARTRFMATLALPLDQMKYLIFHHDE